VADVWSELRSRTSGATGAGTNIASCVLTRHVRDGTGSRPALLWRPREGSVRTYSYAMLDELASRFADGVRKAGVGKGDTVTVMAGRSPELFVSVLGALRAGAVPSVLFSSYGPDPVRRRLAGGRTRLLVTTEQAYETRVAAARAELPHLARVLLIHETGFPGRPPRPPAERPDGVCDFHTWLSAQDPSAPDEPVQAEDPALLHFTSGTTGEPKGVIHVHDAVVAHAYTGRVALGLGSGTRMWCTADPGWVTGVSYGILAPLANGSTVFVDEEEDVRGDRWYENLTEQRIEVLYSSPSTLRRLRHSGDNPARWARYPDLRSVFFAGEPLAAAEALWTERAFGVHVRDTWWQTETGCIVVASRIDEEPRPGRIGHALPAFEVAILERVAPGHVRPLAAGREGELAVRAPWPSMFRGYIGSETSYDASFADGWYLSGDLAVADEHGWIRFLGRTDDVFKSEGHFVAPAEVEATLLEHAAVADAAVVGHDDPLAGTQVEAYVVLAGGTPPSDQLRNEILEFALERLGPALAPRSLTFRETLPRTPSGKIVRRSLLRA